MAKANVEKEVVLIPVIEEFLASWKEKARTYYIELSEQYGIEAKKEYPITEENLKLLTRLSFKTNRYVREYTDEQIAEIMNGVNAGEKHWVGRHNLRNITVSIHSYKFNMWKNTVGKGNVEIARRYRFEKDEFLEKLLTSEVNGKRAKLFATVEKKAGKILDASGLGIGVDGGINGLVVGETKTVRVTTIYAGGYNIQCLHYRVLVK